MKPLVSKLSTSPYVPGRRTFLTYRDLGVADASDGRMRAQVTAAKEGLSKPTGWHFHVCEGQFVYMLHGWSKVQFEDGTVKIIEAGDSVFIPGGVKHNEIATSDVFECIEISVPADMGTVECAAPELAVGSS
jgi:quercetin dioxygenase-like cupin family protein